MNSFLCRVMTFVFLLNCLTPTAGWGQAPRRTNTSALQAQVSSKVEEAEQNNTPAAQFARADKEARDAHNARFAQADKNLARNNPVSATQMQQTPDSRMLEVAPASSLYVAPRVVQGQESAGTQIPAQLFLKKVTDNEISFENLIDYADPMDPDTKGNDLLTIAYAAEVISNTVSEAMQLDSSQYDMNEMQASLAQIQARLLWRMALLGLEAPSYAANPEEGPVFLSQTALQASLKASANKTMALASLRMALLKIHQFYQAKKLPDPADEYQKEMLVKQAVSSKRMVVGKPQLNDGLISRFPKTPQQLEQERTLSRRKASQMVEQRGNLATFMNQFISELKQSLDEEPKQGSAAFQHAQIRAEYATAYALEYDPSFLKQIVALVDKGPKETDFKQDFSPLLNAIFVTVFENTRYSTMGEAKTKQVLELLQEFSDPQKYSLPTRIFALEAAGLLFRPFNQDAFNLKQKQPAFAFFAPVNFNKPDENLRRLFAARVAELYCPLVSTQSSQMKDYGLSSDEMQALADKLAYIYDGFYDIHTAWVQDKNAPANTKVHANYPTTSCVIVMHNKPNALKTSNEQVSAFLSFSAEVLFWVYGGELFSFLGTAYRLTRGAVAALPKAGKAFTLAARGEKIAAFNAQIQEGAKFANWVAKNRRQQGYLLEAVVQKAPARVEKEVVITDGVAETVRREIPAVTEYKPVTSAHQLEGKFSSWNPKRWFGMSRGEDIVGYRVTRMKPGLQSTVAEMRFGQPIDGLHSLQEISQMTHQLRKADGTRFFFEQQPYWRGMMNMNQAMQERWLLDGLHSSFKNQMDLWIPLGEAAQKTGTISETTRWWNVSQWGAPEKWGALVGKDMWGKAGKGGISAGMPVYVAPRTPFQFVGRRAAHQLVLREPRGIANISEVLPGFYTSGADMATGNVYSQMFNAYMKPLNWQGTLAKTFLPDYVPTKAFWQSMRVNPVLGAQLAPRLLWRNRFAATTAFFGAWMGGDRLLYPPFKSWMEGRATKDARQEIAQYGDTFSPQQAKRDELLLQEMGVDLSDQRAMTTYNDVLAAQPDQPDGTLLTAPIIGARRALGMSFLGDDVKVDYAQQAQRTDLNRALLHRNYNRFKEGQQATEKWQQEQRAAIEQDEQNVLAMYAQGFAVLPQVKDSLHRVYQMYAQEFLASKTQQEAQQAAERFNQRGGILITQAAEWDNALKTAEDLIVQAKELYAAEPGLITPQVENYIRQALRTYAAKRCDALQAANPQAVADKAAQDLETTLSPLWVRLSVQYRALHPEEQPAQPQEGVEYGVDFNPNAAEE